REVRPHQPRHLQSVLLILSAPAMRERILDYLNRSSEPLRADRILRDVLKIVSPNVIAADRILGHIVGGDVRFARDATGLWSAAAPRAAPDLGAAVLDLE